MRRFDVLTVEIFNWPRYTLNPINSWDWKKRRTYVSKEFSDVNIAIFINMYNYKHQ